MATDIVQEIKLRTDLVELISAYVPLRQAGRTHKGLCPFHAEKTPSFVVDGERGFFKCYGCGAKGDCFSFLQQKDSLDFNTAGEVLARRLGLEWHRRGDSAESRSRREQLYDVTALAERFFRQSLAQTPEVTRYLLARGLTEATIEEFRLGYAPGGYEALLGWLRRQKASLELAEEADLVLKGEHERLRDRFVDRVMFPISDLEGRTIAFGGRALRADVPAKYLNSRETPIFQKGRTLYGLHLAKRAIPENGFAVIVEGYMDLIALHQAGIHNSVAGLGTAFTDQNAATLQRYLGKEAYLVFCYDGDSAGMRAVEANASKFESMGVDLRVAALPEGADPDTYIQQHGSDSFRALLTRAEPLLDYGLNHLRLKYNLSDESARLPFVREAARLIARSGSHLTRQEYAAKLSRVLDRLADEWYPGEPHRAMQARVALSHEVNRLLRTDRIDGAASSMGVRGTPPPVPKAGVSAEVRAQREVLRATLSEYRWAQQAADRLTLAHFTDEVFRGLAEKLFADYAGEGQNLVERTYSVRNDPENAELVSELLIEEAPLSDEAVAGAINLLERAWKQRRKEELLRVIEQGELTPDDPRWHEYRQLNEELKGRSRRED